MALRLKRPSPTHPPEEPASRGRFGKAQGGPHLKATCFLAHLSMSHPDRQSPCVLVSLNHLDRKTQQWGGKLHLASPDMTVASVPPGS